MIWVTEKFISIVDNIDIVQLSPSSSREKENSPNTVARFMIFDRISRNCFETKTRCKMDYLEKKLGFRLIAYFVLKWSD